MTLHERETELDNCSFCKAILMMLIVLYHVILPWAGKWSNIEVEIPALPMPVYLIHQQVSYLLSITLNGVISPYIQVIVNFAFTLFVSLALSTFLYKFKFTRKMLGENT